MNRPGCSIATNDGAFIRRNSNGTGIALRYLVVDLALLREFLLRARNADGGWGYQPGKASRLEPTCWASLALGNTLEPRVLEQWPCAGGLLLERDSGTPNYAFHAQALIALRALNLEHTAGNRTLLGALQRVKGTPLPPSTINRQDNSLQAWSWIDGTFSWVEPTAWSLLALKQWAASRDAVTERTRIVVAEQMLIDRCCAKGGWNYGNANMLGQELKPFVPTTAIALLSLQDRESLPEVGRSVAFLEREATSERSGTALALALMALRAYGRSTDALRQILLAQLPTTLNLGKVTSVAMSLYALGERDRHAAVAL